MTAGPAIATLPRPAQFTRSSSTAPGSSILSGSPRKPLVFLLSSGLGNSCHGPEAFMQACYRALRAERSIEVRLFKGSRASAPGETSIRCMGRDTFGARALGEIFGHGSYAVEQATFATSLLPHIEREAPDVIYFSDPAVGRLLWHWRRWRNGSFRLLFCNNGGSNSALRWCDHVHQVTPGTVEDALANGFPLAQQTLLPHGLDFSAQATPPAFMEQVRWRRALGLPLDRPILLSVGALNRREQRMDYLVHEVASMPSPRPYVVMLGRSDEETSTLRASANLMLGENGFRMATVSRDQVSAYYLAADLFTSASSVEDCGLVFAEALSFGLPCLAHDFPSARYVLGDQGFFADLRERGALRRLIRSILHRDETLAVRIDRSETVRRRFSWDRLTSRYVEMLMECTGVPQLQAERVAG